MNLGKIGVWRMVTQGSDVVAEIEALGYGALWVGGSPAVHQMRPYLETLSRLALIPTSCYPNAGLPNAFGGYDETPETTSTGPGWVTESVPSTSSASYPAAPMAIPAPM